MEALLIELKDWALSGGVAAAIFYLWFQNRFGRLARAEGLQEELRTKYNEEHYKLALCRARVAVLEGQLRDNNIEPHPPSFIKQP